MLRGAYGYGTCLSKLVSHPFFTNHTYGTQEEEDDEEKNHNKFVSPSNSYTLSSHGESKYET